MEVDFDCDLDPDWVTVLHGRLELPVLDGLHGLFVEAHAEAAQNADVAGTAIGSDDQAEGTDALVFRFASLFRKFRLGGINLARRGKAAAPAKDASTGTTAFGRAEPWAFAGTDTATT